MPTHFHIIPIVCLCVSMLTGQEIVTLKASSTNTVTLHVRDQGISLEEFLHKWTEATGRRFSYLEPSLRGKATIRLTGDVTVPREKADQLFRSLLVQHGFALIRTGPPEANLFAIESTRASPMIKQQATYVPEGELSGLGEDFGRVIMTTIRLQHVEVTQVRGAVQQVLANRNIEFAQEVASANALVVVGFAPTVHALYQVLRAIDLPSQAPTLKFARIRLQHAMAKEMQPIVAELVSRDARPPGRGPSVPGQFRAAMRGRAWPLPKIVADPRTNSLVVYALACDLREITKLVAELDTEAEPAPGKGRRGR